MCVCVCVCVCNCACIAVANSDFGATSSVFLFLLSMSLQGQLETPASQTQSKGSMARSCTPQRGDSRPSTPRTPRERKVPTTPPGIGAAAHDSSAALRRFLKSSTQSIAVLRTLLISDPAAAILPFGDGQPVIIYAMRHKVSLEVLRTLLVHGAQPEQVDPQGRNSLSALAAMSVDFTDGELRMMPYGRLSIAGGYRPCAVLSRLHVSYAVELMKAGVQPVVEDVGEGNEACAACIREYKDALVSVVIRRWIGGDGSRDWLRLVAAYIYC